MTRARVLVATGAAVVLAALLVGVAALVDDEPDRASVEAKGAAATASSGWSRLPEAPLGPRSGATAAWTGAEIVVVGGWNFLCPPNADCAAPKDPPFTDGAAFDPTSSTWRPIAPTPIPFHDRPAAVVEGDVYVLAPCTGHWGTGAPTRITECPQGADAVLLRYDPDADEWSLHRGPPRGDRYALASVGSTVLAYTGSDEQGEVPDYLFDTEADGWRELPDDPLPPVFDRQIVVHDSGREVLLFGAAIAGSSSSEPKDEPVLGARLDVAAGTWSSLPPSPQRGYRAWGIDGQVVLEPHFGGHGGLFDPTTGKWSALPPPPAGSSWDSNQLSGALGRRDAIYADSSGWVLDVTAGQWVEVPPIDERTPLVEPGASVTAVGRDLFVFGGERWPPGGQGELLDDAWLWSAPSAS